MKPEIYYVKYKMSNYSVFYYTMDIFYRPFIKKTCKELNGFQQFSSVFLKSLQYLLLE